MSRAVGHPFSARAGTVRRLAVLILVLVLVSTAGVVAAGCGDDLAGTTWKASVMGNDITMKFGDDGTCTVTYGLAGMETNKQTGAYSVDGDQVTIGEGDDQMVLTRSGDTMTGTAQGVELTFTRE
jgi:hypothetical protein